jgi:hypothetical protein
VVNLGCKSRRTYLVEACVFVDIEREAIRAHGSMENYCHLVLLLVVYRLHRPNQPCALW